jgi:hypothetical protein
MEMIPESPRTLGLVITYELTSDMKGIEVDAEILTLRVVGIPITMRTAFSYLVDADRVRVARIKAVAIGPLTKREIMCSIRPALDG